VSDLGEIEDYATFDERQGVATLHYKVNGKSTIETIKVGDLIDAGTLIMARGWQFTADAWNYSALDGYTVGIKRKEY
jgi:hypothetical protein